CVPGIFIVRREHMPWLETADEIVMAVNIPVVTALDKPGTAAGAAGHIAGDRDDCAPAVLPALTGPVLTGLPGLSIERISGRITVSIEGLTDRLIIGPANTANDVGQGAPVIR